ncbi:MAG TPA: OB-fold domain-containing protein [Acidimicrobiales bacterium]|nr:OB-fold domain-containing protein [Acidimicrobiales bacterium]
MPPTKTRVPAVEGWLRAEEPPALVGSRCTSCGTYAFPREAMFCRNPSCAGTEFDEVALSRRGRIWSYTDARYTPPAPYVAADPYEPFCIAAVELDVEKMVVLGQVTAGVTVDDLAVGTEVELVVDTLYEDDDHEYLVWKWRPVGAGRAGTAGAGSGGDDA